MKEKRKVFHARVNCSKPRDKMEMACYESQTGSMAQILLESSPSAERFSMNFPSHRLGRLQTARHTRFHPPPRCPQADTSIKRFMCAAQTQLQIRRGSGIAS
jgi:hypothetical protein